jgi:hypothetical protein
MKYAVPHANILTMLIQSALIKVQIASTNTLTALKLPSQSSNAKGKKLLQDAANHAEELKKKVTIELMAKQDVLIPILNADN